MNMVFAAVVFHLVISHLHLVRIRKHFSSVTQKDDPATLAAIASGPVVQVEFVVIWALLIKLVSNAWSSKLSLKAVSNY